MTAADRDISATLKRIADALERLTPAVPLDDNPRMGAAFVWAGTGLRRTLDPPVQPLDRICGIDSQKAALMTNTERLAHGLPAHDVLLWGARGMGKSSLVKSVHVALRDQGADLALVQVPRDDIGTLPVLLRVLRDIDRRFLIYCDDLSFEADEHHYKSLRSVLDGGIEGRPDNVRIYVTSNRRHLIARDATENDALNPRDVADDRLALADRFGLSLGFHNADQATYLAIVHAYTKAHALPLDEADALAWSMARGSRSGRVAWQYVQELAGREGIKLSQDLP